MYLKKTKDLLLNFVLSKRTILLQKWFEVGATKNGAVTKTPSGCTGVPNISNQGMVNVTCTMKENCNGEECHAKICCQYRSATVGIETSSGPGGFPSHNEDDCMENKRCKLSVGTCNFFRGGVLSYTHI